MGKRKPRHGETVINQKGEVLVFWGFNKGREEWRTRAAFDRAKQSITVDKEKARRKRVWFLNYAKSHRGCYQCGERDPAALCFHHVGQKRFSIGNATHYKWSTIVEELRRCVVMCHNCHAKHHAGTQCNALCND